MTKICTNEEVFDFMGTGTEERDSNGASVSMLIDNVQFGIEQYIGRKLSRTAFDIDIHNGRYCSIQGNLIFLKSFYYDIVSITSITEDGVSLTEDVDFVVENPNIIERIDSWWNDSDQLSINIVGYCGLVYDSSGSGSYVAFPDIKQIAIEEVAVRSGLWTKIIDDGQGNEFAVSKSNLSKQTLARLNRYVLPVV